MSESACSCDAMAAGTSPPTSCGIVMLSSVKEQSGQFSSIRALRAGLSDQHREVGDADDEDVGGAVRVDDRPVGHQRTGLLDEGCVATLCVDVGLVTTRRLRVEAAQDLDPLLLRRLGLLLVQARGSPELAM